MRAQHIARKHSSQLTICTIVDQDLPDGVLKTMKAEAQFELERLSNSIAYEHLEVVVSAGEPVQSILTLGDTLDADLIVLGVHRHRPLWDLFTGTTMERIVHASSRPVLLVPLPVKADYRSILGGIDFSPSCEAAIRLATAIGPKADFATFHSVHVPRRKKFRTQDDASLCAPLVEEAKDRINAWWEEKNFPSCISKPQVVPMALAEAFQKLRYDVRPDLLAVGAHGRTGFASGLLGDFTESVIREQFCDVLVVRG